MTIGALAERTGISAETIRYYERTGVLPEPTRGGAARSHAGYRRYDDTDVARLRFVRRARALGFALGDVRDLLSVAGDPRRPCAEVDLLARTHLAQVEARLAELTALRGELQRIIGGCRGGLAVAECEILREMGAAVG